MVFSLCLVAFHTRKEHPGFGNTWDLAFSFLVSCPKIIWWGFIITCPTQHGLDLPIQRSWTRIENFYCKSIKYGLFVKSCIVLHQASLTICGLGQNLSGYIIYH